MWIMRPWDLKTVLRSSSAGWMISFLTGTPDRIRTYDTWLRKPVLYPLSYGRARFYFTIRGRMSKCHSLKRVAGENDIID